MILGYDAKRAFFNRSGLGNYSRDTLRLLMQHLPGNEYHLFSPRPDPGLFPENNRAGARVHYPVRPVHMAFPSYWRSGGLVKDLKNNRIQVFHGLSNEIPAGLRRAGIRSVVTIHDLIFLRYPGQYPLADRLIYTMKTKMACRQASCIVAISEQTKTDLVELLGVSPERIRVVYQGCHPVYSKKFSPAEKKEILNRYSLPGDFLFYVGTVEKRKNLLNIVRAIHAGGIEVPLVVAGRQREYAEKVKEYIRKNRIGQVYFLDNVPLQDLPALYQSARMLVYPSLFEGFGIPILEALRSGIPVVTSKEGCFREVAGDAALYANPLSPEDIALQIIRLLEDDQLYNRLKTEASRQEALFRDELIARNWEKLYNSLL